MAEEFSKVLGSVLCVLRFNGCPYTYQLLFCPQETDRLLGQQYNDDAGYYDQAKVGISFKPLFHTGFHDEMF